MNCQEVKQFSSDYLDQRLTPEQAASFEEHLHSCSSCMQEVESLQVTVSLVGSLGEIETSPDFLAHVRRKIEKKAKVNALWRWLFEPMRLKVPLEITALVLLGVGALHLYYRSPNLYREAGAPVPPNVRSDKTAESTAGTEVGKKKAVIEYAPASPERLETTRDEPKTAGEEGARAPDRFQPLQDRPKEESLDKSAKSEDKDRIQEIRVESVSAYEQVVRRLVAESGGKIVAEVPSSPRGLWLTVEVPQSREGQFLSALKDRSRRDSPGTRSSLQSAPEPSAARRKTIETDALTAGSSAPASEPPASAEPKVTLRIHIIAKE